MTQGNIGQIAYEAFRAYCKTIGDYAQPAWEGVPQWQKDSLVNGVEFLQKNPDATPEDVHNNWMDEKKKAGWKYVESTLEDGTKVVLPKNVVRKIHPLLVPFDKLTKEQQFKNVLFIAMVAVLSPKPKKKEEPVKETPPKGPVAEEPKVEEKKEVPKPKPKPKAKPANKGTNVHDIQKNLRKLR